MWSASKKFTVDKPFVTLCGQTGKAAETLLTYHATGPGAMLSARAPEAKQLTDAEAAAYTAQKILAPWTPSFSQ